MKYKSLEERIDQAFRQHVERDNGLIAGPNRLKEKVLAAVTEWLKHDESLWAEAGEETTASALKDLRENQLK